VFARTIGCGKASTVAHWMGVSDWQLRDGIQGPLTPNLYVAISNV
jgi:hypothetical protein